MDNYKKTLIWIDRGDFTLDQRVQLIELLMQGLTIGTIQEIADLMGKSYNGVKNSSRFKKIKLGSKTLAIAGVCDDGFPF